MGISRVTDALKLTARSRLTARPALENLANNRVLRLLGWREALIRDLSRELQTVLRNYERLMPGQPRFKLFLHEKPKNGNAIIVVNKHLRQVDVYLNHIPQEVFNIAPLVMGQELADVIFDTKPAVTAYMVNTINTLHNDLGLIQRGTESIISLYRLMRGIGLPPPMVAVHFAQFITRGYEELARTKMAHDLLKPYAVPRSLVEDSIQAILYELYGAAAQIIMDNMPHAWSFLATLAKMSVIAREAGSYQYEKKCFDVLLRDFGEELAAAEFLQLDLSAFSVYTRYPAATRMQLGLAIDSFQHIFMLFKSGYEVYYSSLDFEDMI